MSTATGTPRSNRGPRRKKGVATQTEVCSVRLGEGLFGIPISHILEIAGGTHPQPVPQAPCFVGGLVHYRGDVLTTVSLRRLLDLPDREGPQDMLVLESAAGPFGVLVDSVRAVITVSSSDYEANPSTINERRRALFAGAYKLNDALIVMLDPEKLDPIRLARAA